MSAEAVAFAIFLVACCPSPPAKPPRVIGGGSGSGAGSGSGSGSLDELVEGQQTHGFVAKAVYLDDADRRIGARFVHAATGFTLDYLLIESAPQGFIWVTSFPTSDKGEPHTQEHLLLGKGDRGRRMGSFQAMALAESSAFTAQWRTAYHFHTIAGDDAYWPVFEDQLDALLYPDYTNEEIRREVRNFGVDAAPDGALHLEEKGTVYNEMVRTYEQPEVGLWRVAGQLVYGASHPLALDSGGHPDAIREMTPADIRAFHARAYHLANMGMVGAFPSSMSLATVLDRTSAILDGEAKRAGGGEHRVQSEAELPPPSPAAAGTIRVVEYPFADATNPGPLMLAWPATRGLDDAERTLLGLFLDTFAGDESTVLYKKLVDGKTRAMDLGANATWSMVSTDDGQPVFVGLSGVKADKLDQKTIIDVRSLVDAELVRIAQLPDGDPALVAFDEGVKTRVIDLRRRMAKFLDSPPGFGFRGIGSSWIDHLHLLAKNPGFVKSLTMKTALAKVDEILASGANPWRDRLRQWNLLRAPFGVAARPSPALRKQLDEARAARIADELARLKKQYGAPDDAATLARFRADYDAATKRLEDAQHAAALPPLVASPPMTLDDGLHYETGELAGVRSFVATFDSMASARVQLAFDVVHALPPDEQLWLAALPTLLNDAGVIDETGAPIAADAMRERIRREILELSVYYTTNRRTGRVELVVAGAGNGAAESKAALAWMRRVLLAPDWRADNLPRLRDLIDQQLVSLRQRMLGAEENWVDDPRDAWRLQRNVDYLHAASFLTQAHDLHRLRWMLLDPGDAKATAAAAKQLDALAKEAKKPRAQLVALAAELASGKRASKLVQEAGKDLSALLPAIPDSSLANDWTYLCKQMAHDLRVGAPAALAKLADTRARIVRGDRARLVVVGSPANRAAFGGELEELVRALPQTTSGEGSARGGWVGPLEARLSDRGEGVREPMLLGLVNPSTSSGVFENLAPLTSYERTDEPALLDYLAANLYTGHGAHSIFMKTWAAGLAYSNGLHPRVAEGVIDYYAERCPSLPQTIGFVIDQLRAAKPDANLARYAIASAFSSRVANGYERRASAMAADLVDGITPDLVRGFRTQLLALAKRDDLAAALFARMPAVYGKVLPGYGALDPAATYFVIGPEPQLAAYEQYLRARVDKALVLHRLYPRDFWIVLDKP
jgi:Zn-dependent M16 (insulinase) family peptidase